MAGALGLAALLRIAFFGSPPPGNKQPETAGPPAVHGEVAPAPPAHATSVEPALEGLRGTRPSGGLEVDGAGHFVPTKDALLFFQYFLSASNEATPEELVEHMRAAIGARLAPPADAEAAAFLARYMMYLAAGDEEFREPGLADAAALERRVQWVRELRREHFGAELAERLFGEEESVQRVELERRRIAQDSSLDPEEARRQLLALESEYPESIQRAREQASLPLRHASEELALRESGAPEAEVDVLREERFGREAADRMAALDAARADWSARIAAYRSERDALVATIDDPGERELALGELRDRHFTGNERQRVEILDRQSAPLR